MQITEIRNELGMKSAYSAKNKTNTSLEGVSSEALHSIVSGNLSNLGIGVGTGGGGAAAPLTLRARVQCPRNFVWKMDFKNISKLYFCSEKVFKIKWPKSEEKLEFKGR